MPPILMPTATPGAPPWGLSLGVTFSLVVGALIARVRLLPGGYPDDDPDGLLPLAWCADGTNSLEVVELRDTATEAPLEGAVITATWADADRTSRPDLGALVLAPDDDTPGTYRWRGELPLVAGARYRLRIEIMLGGHKLALTRWVVVQDYRGDP